MRDVNVLRELPQRGPQNCQIVSCRKRAKWVNEWRTPIMPCTSFIYMCPFHAANSISEEPS